MPSVLQRMNSPSYNRPFPGRLFAAEVGGCITEEYVVLVRQDRAFRSLADLRDAD